MKQETESERRSRLTKETIRHIAEMKIAAYHLDCSPEEYIAECKRRTEAQAKGR